MSVIGVLDLVCARLAVDAMIAHDGKNIAICDYMESFKTAVENYRKVTGNYESALIICNACRMGQLDIMRWLVSALIKAHALSSNPKEVPALFVKMIGDINKSNSENASESKKPLLQQVRERCVQARLQWEKSSQEKSSQEQTSAGVTRAVAVQATVTQETVANPLNAELIPPGAARVSVQCDTCKHLADKWMVYGDSVRNYGPCVFGGCVGVYKIRRTSMARSEHTQALRARPINMAAQPYVAQPCDAQPYMAHPYMAQRFGEEY